MTRTRDFVSSSFRLAASFMMSLRTALGFVSALLGLDFGTLQIPFGDLEIGLIADGNTLFDSSEVNYHIVATVPQS